MSNHSLVIIIFYCSTYMILGPSLIMLNKYILDNLDFPYPLFLSGLGVLFSALVAFLAVKLGFVQLERKDQVEGRRLCMNIFEYQFEYLVVIMDKSLGYFAYIVLIISAFLILC